MDQPTTHPKDAPRAINLAAVTAGAVRIDSDGNLRLTRNNDVIPDNSMDGKALRDLLADGTVTIGSNGQLYTRLSDPQ
ncbi:hypothetical protein [Rhodococcus pyridinivorans]|uniref:hypothetical protein n=1 Tax=Rhodococcus pyridinivorans TaxID=103816 RepID=UPI003AB022FA